MPKIRTVVFSVDRWEDFAPVLDAVHNGTRIHGGRVLRVCTGSAPEKLEKLEQILCIRCAVEHFDRGNE